MDDSITRFVRISDPDCTLENLKLQSLLINVFSEIYLVLVKVLMEALKREAGSLKQGFRKFLKLLSINVVNNVSSVNQVDSEITSLVEKAGLRYLKFCYLCL
jgi:hypothetical protein